jgi:hypothetical protein
MIEHRVELRNRTIVYRRSLNSCQRAPERKHGWAPGTSGDRPDAPESPQSPVPEAERGTQIFLCAAPGPAPSQFAGSCCHVPDTICVTSVVVLSDEVDALPTTVWLKAMLE